VSDLDAADVLAAISRDKKGRAGKVPFVLPKGIGKVEIRPDVEPPEVRSALKVMASREARIS
jgi:3-dehydroquinate synthetase